MENGTQTTVHGLSAMWKTGLIHRHRFKQLYKGNNVRIEKGNHSVWDFPGDWIIGECECGIQEAFDTHGKTFGEVLEEFNRAKENSERGRPWSRFLFNP